MNKFTVALCILPILEKKYGTSATNADQMVLKKQRRTIEGEDESKGEIPFVVTGYGSPLPRPPWLSMFTASMIAKDWALTCGHCVGTIVDPSIWYGKLTDAAFDARQTAHVLNIYFHPAYRAYPQLQGQEKIIDNNLALLRVSPISLQLYGKLLPVDYTSLIGFSVTTVGGDGDASLMNKTGNVQKKHIHLGEGAIITCDKKVRGFNRYLVCLIPKCSSNDHASSAGDSGAPLLYDSKIIAVQNHDFTDGSKIRISYTPISPYIDWISTRMRRN